MVDMKEQNSNILLIKSDTQNERIPLIPGTEYVLGRSDLADIPLEDKKASRKHAILKFAGSSWQILDNGSTNGLYVGSKKVEQAMLLSSGDPCRIGNTRILIEPAGRKDSRPEKKNAALVPSKTGRPAWFLPVLIALLILVLLFVGIALFLPGDSEENNDGAIVITAVEETLPPRMPMDEKRVQQGSGVQENSDGATSSKARAREHYRVGLLFYDSGHLKRAIDEWDLAQTYDDSNTLVIKKLARAIKDLDYEISRHYKAAKSHYKYLRLYEAEQEFMIVTELSHDKNDERYLDSLNKLEAIRKEK